mmetsp:Transcript_26122/g.52498  ORF Transcript_26122/g.52498 Transcript_26122/m.52498 type:complete len:493 (+) Transcript_26122:185-1663(+)
MPWSEIQQKHLSIWPHFTGTLSMIGSGLIIHQVLRSPKNRNRVYHRLLLAMSICDFNTSFWYFLSTWPIPAGTSNVFAPSGTQASCTAQGFFIQFGIATPLYNAALAFYYLLTIRYQWREKRMKKAERYLLAVPLVWASGTSLAALGMTLFNNANLWCWISSVPLGCKGSLRNDGVNDCERGNNQWIYRWIFFYGPLWTAILLSGVAMLLTYFSVAQTEKASSKWKNNDTFKYEPTDSALRKKKEKEESDRKHSKQVSSQAFYYLMAFFLSWTPATLTRLIQMVSFKTYYPLILLMAITNPMQGLLNYLVYMRPRWLAYRKRHPEWGRCMAFAMIFRGEFHRTESTNVRPTNGTSQETRGSGKFVSTVHELVRRFSRKSSVSKKSSVSSGARRSSIDVSASIVPEEHKEEERPFEDVEEHKEEERPFKDVDPEVALGSGEQNEEKSPGVENGTSVVVRSSLRSSFRVFEENPLDEDKKVHFENEDGEVSFCK